MKALTLVLGAILALALGGCANDPVNSNIAILQSPTSTPEQKAAARRFLEWKLAQNQRDLGFQRQMQLAEAYGRAAAAPSATYYDDHQARLDQLEIQTRQIKEQMDYQRVQAENARPPQPSGSPDAPWSRPPPPAPGWGNNPWSGGEGHW
jgi:hypothetical protein